MKLREMAKLLLMARNSPSDVERCMALNGLMVALVKAYAAKYATDEQETMRELLHILLESDPC
jgi:hypothetical protein